jgi:two-component system phosphate regulon sensor histidine kinase PhoR
MKQKPLLLHLYIPLFMVTLLTVIAVMLDAGFFIKEFDEEQTRDNLYARAKLVEMQLTDNVWKDNAKVNEICRSAGKVSATRITIINPDGIVIADSQENPLNMDNHGNRPEVIAALLGNTGASTRYSKTLKQQTFYVAIPVINNGKIVSVVRTSLPLKFINQAINIVKVKLLYASLIIIIISAMVSYFLYIKLSNPISEIRDRAIKFASNDFEHKLPHYSIAELESLASAMNYMAEQLYEKIDLTTQQNSKLEAILTSMMEGVVAIDNSERIIIMNSAAAKLMSVDVNNSHGKKIYEVIRNADFLRFLNKIVDSGKMCEEEIVFHDNNILRYMQSHGVVIKNDKNDVIGILIVLNDVTNLHRLEEIRRDFVANVSHELKTPITSIKGFVESLQDGAIDEPADAQRFLDIIARHADRLNNIIDDLLALSHIEQVGGAGIQMEIADVALMLENAVNSCEYKLSEKNIKAVISCSPELKAVINSPLIEQAVINLIDNAVKYSDSGTVVTVSAMIEIDELIIKVADHGTGIPADALGRVFERFYRVDKGRSRKLGGTGLGLAIVKHILQTHGGHADVESIVGEGSVFSLHIPLK